MVGARRTARAVAVVLALAWAATPGGPRAASPTEYEVKAAYLYYLATFVDWPADTFASGDEPFVVGILGEDPFGPALESTLDGKMVHGRRLVLRRIPRLTDGARCHLLFISSSEKERLPGILGALQGTSVLTVSEMDSFLERGGHIALRLQERKVRFSINLEAAQRARLKVSAQLLKLATPGTAGPTAGAG